MTHVFEFEIGDGPDLIATVRISGLEAEVLEAVGRIRIALRNMESHCSGEDGECKQDS